MTIANDYCAIFGTFSAIITTDEHGDNAGVA